MIIERRISEMSFQGMINLNGSFENISVNNKLDRVEYDMNDLTLIAKHRLNESGLLIACDMRLDNKDEIILKYKLPKNINDIDVIFYSYKKNKNFIEDFIGEFAIIIFDKTNNTLNLFRDHFGFKNIYYRLDKNKLWFSTDLNNIVPKTYEFNEEYFAYYIYNEGTPSDKLSPYRNVYKIPKATKATLDNSRKLKLTKYWGLNYEPTLFNNEEQYIEEFLSIYKDVVDGQLRGSASPAIMMSGGLDSTSIYAIARSQGYPIRPISCIFEEYKDGDEREYIHPILDMYNDQSYKFVNGDDFYMLKDLPTLHNLEEPCLNVLSYKLVEQSIKVAKELGTDVMLSGYAGDQVFGYTDAYLMHYLKKFKITKFLNEVKKFSRNNNNPILYTLQEHALKPLLSNNSIVHNVLTEKGNNLAKNLSHQINKTNVESKFHNFMNQSQGFALSKELGKRQGIDFRFPFMDKRLVEFTFNLPLDLKFDGENTKKLLRKSMRNKLPSNVINQVGKASTEHLVFKGLTNEWEHIEETFEKSELAGMGLVDPEKVKEKLLLYRHGQLNQDMTYYACLEAEIWIQKKIKSGRLLV